MCNQYAKFKDEEWKLLEFQITQTQLEKSMSIKLNMCERTIPQLPIVTSKEVLQTKEYLKLVYLTKSSFGQQ
jgi:hypothetical protein